MAHTYCSLLFHCVFSTKERRRIIAPEMQPRLWAYMGGIAREHKMTALTVGGMEDHVHILLSLPSSLAIAKAMREIKSASSRWVHETFEVAGFEWQGATGHFPSEGLRWIPPSHILQASRCIIESAIFSRSSLPS